MAKADCCKRHNVRNTYQHHFCTCLQLLMCPRCTEIDYIASNIAQGHCESSHLHTCMQLPMLTGCMVATPPLLWLWLLCYTSYMRYEPRFEQKAVQTCSLSALSDFACKTWLAKLASSGSPAHSMLCLPHPPHCMLRHTAGP